MAGIWSITYLFELLVLHSNVIVMFGSQVRHVWLYDLISMECPIFPKNNFGSPFRIFFVEKKVK